MEKQKVLVLDIETAPVLAYVWGLKDENIGLNQIHSDWYVIAWAAKWLDGKVVAYRDQRGAKDMENDKELLKPLWDLLNTADIVVTQNGKNFDSRKLNARFIMHGMNPPSPYKHLDTYQIVRSVAKFTSNKLEYLTDKLCTKYKKLSHKKFPGFSLWKECLAGNTDAWNEMKRYNIHDVLATEEFYGKIRAWAPANSPNVYDVEPEIGCGVCGSSKMQKRGHSISKGGSYPRFQCQDCGRWQSGKKERSK